MKKQFDFLQEASPVGKFLNLLGQQVNLFMSLFLFQRKNTFSFKILFSLGVLFCQLNLVFGQTDSVAISPILTSDICENISLSLSATTFTNGVANTKPIIWSARSTNNSVHKSVFSNPESTTTGYTASDVMDNRTDQIIVTIDEGYPVIWKDPITGIDTTHGDFVCKIAGVGNSGAESNYILDANQSGWVETKLNRGDLRAAIGLSEDLNTNDNRPNTVDFGIEFNNLGQAFVIENDNNPTFPVDYNSTDIFRVERIGSTIVYKKNRTIFYTSTILSTTALVVDASMAVIDQSLDVTVNFGIPNFIFPADTLTVQVLEGVKLDIGPDLEICEGDSVTLQLTSSGAFFDSWNTSTGTFNTSSLVYTPTIPVSVLTRLDEVTAKTTGASNGVCPAAKDTVKITVRQAPTISITTVTDPTLAICEEDSIQLKATPGGNADTIFWTTNNGSFNIANGITNNTLDAIKFEPTEGLSSARTVPIYLKTDSDYSVCPAALDTIDIDVHLRGEVANTYSRASICQTDSIRLAAVLSRGATSLKWELHAGTGTFSPTDTRTNAYYKPSGVVDSVRYDTLLVKTVPAGTPTCDVFVDTVIISVFELDNVTNAFSTFDICEGDSVTMNATLHNVTNPLRWTIKVGNGLFLNSNRTDATYIPADITTDDDFRRDTLLVTTVPPNSCQPGIDTVVVTIHKTPKLTLSQDTTICITDEAIIRAISPRGIVDSIMTWEKLNNGVLAALTDQQPNDTILYKYSTTVPIVFPALSRKDTIVATTGKPTVSDIANVSSGQTCLAAIDTVVVTVTDMANITIPTAPNPLCELETTEIKAKINAGATAVTWKLLPSQIGNGTFSSIDSVTTKYTPNDIAGILLLSRIDTLMAISVGLTGCQPDTAYAFIDVRNAPELAPIADKTICDGKTVVLETEKLGPGNFDTWMVQPAGIGTFNNASAFPKVTYTPEDFASTVDEPRVDTIFFITDNSAYCPAYKDSLFVTINPQHQVSIDDYGMNPSNLDTITICEGSSTLAINAKIGGGTTAVRWTTVGNSGSFNNANTLKPIYTPNTGQTTDIRYDTLIISSSNSVTSCTVARDSIIVQVQRAAVLTTARDTVVCESGTIALNATSIGIGDSVFWEIVNNTNGQFSNSKAIDTTRLSTETVIYNPTLDVTTQFRIDTIRYFTETPLGVCPIAEDTIFVSVYNAPTVEVDDPTKSNDTLYVCEGIGLSLDGAYGGGAVGATWSVLSNAGVFSEINDDTIATYTPNPGVTTTTRVDTVILTSDIIGGTCSSDIMKDTLYVIVQQGPVVTAVEDSLTMCEGTSINLKGAFGSVATGFTWSTKIAENGSVTVLTDTTATYTPTGTITGSGRLDVIYLTSTNGTATCLTAVDSIEIFVSAKPVLELGSDVSMCGNLSQVLTPQSIGLSNLLTWTSTNGTFATNPSPTGLYQPDFMVPTNNRLDGIIVTSIDSLELCPAIKDTMLVTVYGLARVAIGATGTVCEDDSLSLNPAFAGRLSDFTYTVSNNAGMVAVNNNELLYIPNENTTQLNRIDEVIINLGDVDGTGACPSLIDTIDITVLNTPRAELIKDTTICLGEELNLLVESFGLIDTFKSNLSNSLVNYPNLPINLDGGNLKDTILYGTSLIDGACPAVSNQVIVTIQNPAILAINIPDTTICIANTLELTTGLSNPNGYNFYWKVAENNGVFDDTNKATPIYTPNGVTTTSRVDTITVEVVDATNICRVGFDTLLVTVVPSATLADFRDTTICEGETLNLSATISGTANFFWTSNSGTFADSSATQTAYSHAPVNGGNGLDIITGHLVFENDACVGVQKNIKVTVIGESAVNAGLDTTICTSSTLQLAGTMGFGIDSIEWLVLNNSGTFDNAKSLTAIYTPNINTGTTDRVDAVILSTTATLTCIKPLDTLYVTVKPMPTVNLGADLTQTGTAGLILNAVTSTPVLVSQWSANNGAFSNSTLNQTVYSANALSEGETRLDTIIYKGDFGITSCSILSDTLVITFEAPPLISSDDEFCQALCLDTAFVNIDRFTSRAVILANNIDPFDTCAVSTDLTMKLWYPALETPEPINVTDLSALPDSVVYTCENKGYQNLNIYVAVDSMDVRVCPSVIKVEDAFITCGERTISGKITTYKGEPVEGFQVFIDLIGEVGGVVPAPVLTDAEGRYEFTLPSSRMYRITPKNNEDLSKGVTAFDNVIISRHILGLELFDSPFKTIAADVNKSGTVTAFDIVEIRKIVLDRAGAFSNNTSWRFVDASFPFENIMDAAAAPFQESFIVNETMGNTFDMDFIAIKVGDVNGSNFSTLNGESIAADRNDGASIAFEVANSTVKKGEIYEVPFRLLNAKKVAGYQFTLGFDGLELLEIETGVATPAHFSTSLKDSGLIATCWSTAQPVADKNEWFTLQFKATKDGRLSELLTINSAITPIEAYTTDDENIGVQLTFVQPIVTTFDLFQNKPNPFKNETVIGFALPTATKAKITILDMQGKVINRVEGNYESGYNEVIMDMTTLPRGIFYYRLETAFGTKVQKMMHIE